MARIKWVTERLKRWGAWRTRRDSNGLGYAKSSIFMAVPSGGGGSYEAEVPINDLEAAQTDRAVESLRFTRSHLHRVLVLIYVDNAGTRLAARRMARAESTVKANLEEADHALVEWFNLNAPRRADRDAEATPAPTTRAGSFTP